MKKSNINDIILMFMEARMRTKNSFLNMITNLVPSLIIPIISLFKLSWLLKVYGADIYGMNMYLTQVMGYLNLVEGGFGFAFVQALFKPLAKDDKETVKGLYHGASYILKMIGLIILFLGILIYVILPWILKTSIPFSFVRMVFLLMILPTIVDYFLMAPTFVMMADQKEYHLNIIRKTIQLLRAFTHIFIILNRYNYLYIPLVEAIYIVVQSYICRRFVIKRYSWLLEKAPRNLSTLESAKNLFAHRLAGVVLSSTDTILLGAFIGTIANTLYGNYIYITGEIQKILESIINAPKASIGHLFATNDQKSYAVFKEYFSFTTFIATIVCIPLFITINSFVEFWQSKEVVLSLSDAFLFAGILFFVLSRQPIMNVRDTNGLFRESKKFAYLEAVLNFSFSIVGVYFFGITGALFVTFCTYLASDLFMNSPLVYQSVLKKPIREYYSMYLSKLMIAMFVGFFAYLTWQYLLSVRVDNLLLWFIFSGLLFILVSIVISIIYYLCFNDFRLFIQRILKLVNGKVKGAK